MSGLTLFDSGLRQQAVRVKPANQWMQKQFQGAIEFCRSSSIRFAILYVSIFSISAMLLSAIVWYSTLGLMDRQTESAVRAQAQSLARHFNQGGVTALSSTISKRVANNLDDHALYLLINHHGDHIAGNLDLWPALIVAPRQWYRLPVKRYKIHMQAIYRFYPLPDGYQLLVGQDTRATADLSDVLLKGLLIAIIAMILLGVAGGVIVRSLFKRAMGNLLEVSSAISRGDMTSRVKLKNNRDEFDQLGGTINGILDMVERHMDGVRHVTSAIAHDLRTPIARAKSRLELEIIAKEKRPDEWLNVMELAIGDLDKVESIFRSLLRIAEVEAGEQRSAFKEVDLSVTLNNLLGDYEAVAEEQEMKLVGRWDESTPFTGDQQLIEQAIVNLLENAIKFAPPKTTIYLTGSSDEQHVRISVADEGVGIPAPDREKAVRRFYRADQARNTPGSGLGLALVAAVAELHYGKVRLEDNAPGLRVILDLPHREHHPTRSKATDSFRKVSRERKQHAAAT